MTGPVFHTYGSGCLLADEEPELSSLYELDTPPDIRTQFFYVSSLPIDDPLAPLPPLSSGQAPEDDRSPPKPFSARDNIALEKSWRELGKAREASPAPERCSKPIETHSISSGIAVPGRDVLEKFPKIASQGDTSLPSTVSTYGEQASLPNRLAHRSSKGQASNTGVSFDAQLESRGEGRSLGSSGNDKMESESLTSGTGEINRKRDRSSSLNEPSVKKRSNFSLNHDADEHYDEAPSVHANRSRDASISGSPFIRAPALHSHSPYGRSIESIPPKDGAQDERPETRGLGTSHGSHGLSKPSALRGSMVAEEGVKERVNVEDILEEPQLKIPVGASRLHLVELPNLKMKPIYWSPLHDVSSVVRATWFYKNTMMPVETDLANKLEEGYVYLRPWTQTWQDELNSCVENGAEAEMKVVHHLWPKADPTSASRPGTAQELNPASSERDVNHRPEELQFDLNRAAGDVANRAEAVKPYLTSSAIYVDARNAQILRPSLLPSVARGRRPLSAIRKERQIGIPVVRGFSRKRWDQLHPSKASPVDVRHYIRKTQGQATAPAPGVPVCYACRMEEMRPTPSDLVFVVHGIGQKLSERMESFHFTHAINAFRRQVNMELHNDPVWPHVRQEHGGIMVLPVNWRATLSLEDPSFDGPESAEPAPNNYTLKDITPETLPAVRSLISDVMLDIPYYLSHHKPKMIRAVVREANRIYRLWCENNPGFQDNGRIHLIAHSLGSVMAVDILSHQPTAVPRFDLASTPLHSDIFEFDTNNLFLCGSPVGFFLLLNKANLLPRKGRNKPGSEGDDRLRGVAGEAGQYGCLAVDNMYNIVHTTDPIAYRVNAAVDCDLASSLKVASLPSSTSSFIQSFGSVFRWGSTPGLSATSAVRPPMTAKLPSTVEMETHDFTREEIAEKRMLLLNDNGQIDYFLSGGGGPLNIQYLNMLSAHSSYWILPEFVRFLVVEIARKQGRDGTLAPFKAEKKKEWKYSKG